MAKKSQPNASAHLATNSTTFSLCSTSAQSGQRNDSATCMQPHLVSVTKQGQLMQAASIPVHQSIMRAQGHMKQASLPTLMTLIRSHEKTVRTANAASAVQKSCASMAHEPPENHPPFVVAELLLEYKIAAPPATYMRERGILQPMKRTQTQGLQQCTSAPSVSFGPVLHCDCMYKPMCRRFRAPAAACKLITSGSAHKRAYYYHPA
eukprot:1157389-Pelagomonas_calceolata.AAC.6